MIYWFKQLPVKNIDFSNWSPFIRNPWIRRNFMLFVFLLMGFLFVLFNRLGSNSFLYVISNTFSNQFEHTGIRSVITILYFLLLYGIVFVVHKILHIIVVYRQDDISLTRSGLFFWLNTNAVLSKLQFWFFMTLPILGITVIPFIASLFIDGYIKNLLLFIGWLNLIIASSDLINSFLILVKPSDALFCRGYYQYKDKKKV